jgi:hypothetical protein
MPVSVLPPSYTQTGIAIQRVCQGPCGLPIPPIRLAARPNALLCVTCLEASGDVPRLKRFDETTADGDQVQTLFTKNRSIERQMNHLNKSPVADQAMFDIAVGDDVHLGREDDEILDGGRSLSTVFEEEPVAAATYNLPKAA